MEEVFRFIADRIGPLWHRPAVAVSVAVAAAILALLWAAETGVAQLTPLAWVSATVAFVLVCGLWVLTHHVPHVRKGKVGIVVAITSDEEMEAKQIQVDFVRTLRNLLERDPDGAKFQVVVLPSYAAALVTESNQIDRFFRKARGHFMLYGHARRRQIGHQEVHLLSLEGVVRHAPIPIEVSQRLSQDFAQALPRRIMVPRDGDALAFETTSAWVDLSARYIIAIAAHLSGDALYAERLYLNVEGTLKGASQLPATLQPIARSLPERLTQLYRDWLAAASDRYFMTRDRRYVELEDQIATRLLARDPNDYGALLAKGIAEFVLRRDIPSARQAVERCRRIRDVTWRYSVAFLLAYEGQLEAAYHEYRSAFSGTLQNVTVPIQCEEFIHIVLQEEPDKHQLHFCSALINYNAKRDYLAAATDFDRFLASPVANAHPWAKRLAEKLRAKCDRYTSVVGAV